MYIYDPPRVLSNPAANSAARARLHYPERKNEIPPVITQSYSRLIRRGTSLLLRARARALTGKKQRLRRLLSVVTSLTDIRIGFELISAIDAPCGIRAR